MKKIIALLLAVWMLVSLTGCSESMTSAERFLLAVKKMEFEAKLPDNFEKILSILRSELQ